jgi:DNA-binding NarL/FixJ family response regulator
MTLRVLIADDQEMVRTGLRMILEAQPDIEVVAEAADGNEAIALANEFQPDVCLMDIRMPGVDGIMATRELADPSRDPLIAVVIITTFDLDDYVYGALRAGAKGFLLKDAKAEFLVDAVRAAAAGDALVSPSVTARLIEHFSGANAQPRPAEPLDALTVREEEVLKSLARGNTNAEIGAELHISLSTVKSHVNTLMTKLNARNRVELAIWAHQTSRLST